MDLARSMPWMLSETMAAWVSLIVLEAVRLKAVRSATRLARATRVRVREKACWLRESTISFIG